MSYILEALRKAERERSLGQVPNLETIPALSLPPQRHFWPWLLVLALLTNATVLAIVLLSPWSSTRIAQPPEITPSVTQPEPRPPEKTSPSELKAGPAEFALDTPPLIKEPSPEKANRLQESAPSIGKVPKAQATPPPPKIAELPPSLQALPAAFSRSIPAINLDIHVHSTIPSKRFVLINSKRYREGDQLSEGPLLEAITSDGVILRHQGQRFLIPVHR